MSENVGSFRPVYRVQGNARTFRRVDSKKVAKENANRSLSSNISTNVPNFLVQLQLLTDAR